MKKSIKMMALGLAVVPCALMLTACGGETDKDIVNIKGTYTEIESTQYSTVIEDIDNSFNLEDLTKGLKVFIDVDASTTMYGMKVNLSMENEMIAKCPAVDGYIYAGDMEAYTKSSVSVNMTMGEDKAQMKGSAKSYIVDGVQYMDMSGMKEMLKMTGSTQQPTKYYQQLLGEDAQGLAIPDFSLGDVFAQIPEGEWGQNIVISKHDSETGYKLKVVAKADTLNAILLDVLAQTDFGVVFTEDVELYLIYENEEFAGLYLDANATINAVFQSDSDFYQMFGPSLTVTADLNVQMAGFDGEINYPSFKGYVDIEA